jgi:hypothetical protein
MENINPKQKEGKSGLWFLAFFVLMFVLVLIMGKLTF